jgi:formate dehydrogenase major subunit
VKVRVDGRDLDVDPGTSVLRAIRSAGAIVPSLCFDERVSPAGSCRTCLVGVDGRREPICACTSEVAEGMAISTTDDAALAAARASLELIVSELPERALSVEPGRSELVRACQQIGVDASRFSGARHERRRDDSHPYVKFDPDLCIACGRCVRMCDEVQGTFALSLVGRGFETVVAPGGASWANSACVACGGCVDSCPTGALSEPGLLDPRAIDAVVTTTCGYCGVGCSLDVYTRARDEIAAIKPTRESPINRGHACVKGRFAHAFVRSRDRLTDPLIRRNGQLERATWDEALEHISRELTRIKRSHGPDAIAAISSSRATNEDNFMLQKLMRAVIGTNNIDNCSRLCHAPTAAGLAASFGLAGGTGPFEEMDRSECFLLVGANPTEAHPVVGARIKQRVLAGAGLVVVDPRRTELARYADVHLAGRPGSNVAVFHGLAHVLIEEDLIDRAFVDERTEGLGDLEVLLREYSPESVEQISSVPAEDLRRAARIYARGPRSAIVYGLGVTEHAHGTDGVRALANLALLTGNVGRDSGGGVFPLRGQNNVQGAADLGTLPDLLPGYQRLTDDDAVARFEAEWGVTLSRQPGLRIPEMFDAALAGRLKALYVFGEDIAQTDPDSERVVAAMEACEFIVSQEIFLSRTAERADVVLPGSSFLEKDGTFVNFDRRFQRVRTALPPPGRARTDFEIIAAVARAMGGDLGCTTPAEALDEVGRLCPNFAGISHARLDRDGPLHWPCRSADDPGEGILYRERFATASGRARIAAPPYRPPGEEPDERFPFVLVTGRRLEHYNAGTMTRRTDNLRLRTHELVEMNPEDASRLELGEGDVVEVVSRRGAVAVPLMLTDSVAVGQLFMDFHFPEVLTNALTSDVVDSAGCPEYKVTAVLVRPITSTR